MQCVGVQGAGFRVQGAGCREQGEGCTVIVNGSKRLGADAVADGDWLHCRGGRSGSGGDDRGASPHWRKRDASSADACPARFLQPPSDQIAMSRFLITTGARWNPGACATNQCSGETRFDPALRDGGRSCGVPPPYN